MNHHPLTIALKNQFAFYKSLRPHDFLFLFLVYFFISWNGVQFLINPKHLLLIMNPSYLNENFQSVINHQASFLPAYIFILITFIIIFYLLKVYYEIGFSHYLNKEKIGVRQKINILIDFAIPSLYYQLGILFILLTIYLALIIIYMLLLTIGVFINLDFYDIIFFSVLYFLIGLCVFNVCLFDFILPELRTNITFSAQFKHMLIYFSNNILNLIIFYLLKMILISTSVILLIYFLMFVFSEPVFNLLLINDFNDGLYVITVLIVSMITSMVMFSIFVNFFSLYCRFLKLELFKDYFNYHHISSDNSI